MRVDGDVVGGVGGEVGSFLFVDLVKSGGEGGVLMVRGVGKKGWWWRGEGGGIDVS